MAKKKYRKLTTNVQIKRKLIINITLIILAVFGIGYSYLNANFGIQGEIAVSRLKVTCEGGTYLAHASKACSACPAGSFCPGNTFSYDALNNQGIISCPIGSYSAASQSSCAVCVNGKTTSNAGSTSCEDDCANNTGVSTWVNPTISGETVTNLCVIDTCREGYTKNENSCVANTYQVGLDSGENITTTGSETVTVTFDSSIPNITPPTKRGYTFGGYYLTIEHDDPEPDEEIKYINADGTSAHVWDLTTGTTLHANWTVITITCGAGEYLPADATSCSSCPEGSGCPGGDYNYNATTPQGSNLCQPGSYSTGGAATCSICQGGATSTTGQTSCDSACSNAAHVSTWESSCNIATCDTGYENVSNVCTAKTFTVTLNNQGADVAGSTSVTTTYNAPVPSITTPEKTGYTFGGYYTEANGAGVQYIKEDGTSFQDWDVVNVTELFAKWTIISSTCSAGQYLPQGTTTCSNCPAGSFCIGGNYNYNSTNDQGITACAVGSYSAASSSTCIMCNGSTTSGVGQTSCNANCSNSSNASTWNTPNWNNNEPTGICSINTCQTGYHLGSNVCEANELNFADQTITVDYDSENDQNDTVASASNGTGTYTYTKKSGDSDITVSSAGVITIPAGKNAGNYTIVITASDANSAASKDATYTIKIKKVAATLTCSNKTYDGTEQTACTCTGGTVGGDFKATNANTYTATCTGDANHNSPSNETWTMSPKEIAQVTNLTITPTGSVSWTNSSDATSYQISIDNTNWTSVPAGTTTTTYNFLNSIVGSTGERTIYVKGINSDTTNYSSTTATATTTVYAVAFNVDNDNKGQVSPTSLNVITGSTYTTTDNVLTLQDGRDVTATPKTATGVTNSFDSWSSTSGTIIAATTITANFTSAITNYNVTYNANTGTFTDSSTTNSVSYNVTKGTVTKYSHTANVDDTGLKTANYGNSWNNSNITGTERGDTSKAHVVSIPGASTLTVELYYNGESVSYDWVSVWAGSYPNYTASDYSSTGAVTTAMGGLSTNKYGASQSGSYTVNGNSLTSMGHSTLTIPGDTVTFGFRSDSGGYGQGYGYYAIITGVGKTLVADSGTYIIPTKTDYVFTGWNKEPDGSGTSISKEADIANLSDADVTLYAQYREPTATFKSGQEFNAAIKQASGNTSATYSTSNTNITNFTKYTGEFTESLRNNAVKVSSDDSESDIYAWFDNGTIYYYTASDTIYFNSDSSYMFNYLTNFTTLDLSEFNLSKVTSSSSIFSNMTALDTIITPKVNSSSSISIGKTMINQSNTTYSSITSSTPTETTLKVPYMIIFDLNGGMNSTCTAINNTKQIYPGNPVGTIPTISAQKFGYTQGGWCSDSSCNNTINLTAETVPPSSITYYIQWTKDGVWAENISYSHSGIDCSDTQCILEHLANNYKEKRVSINGN